MIHDTLVNISRSNFSIITSTVCLICLKLSIMMHTQLFSVTLLFSGKDCIILYNIARHMWISLIKTLSSTIKFQYIFAKFKIVSRILVDHYEVT